MSFSLSAALFPIVPMIALVSPENNLRFATKMSAPKCGKKKRLFLRDLSKWPVPDSAAIVSID
jgi:hypothetical protein